MRLDHLDPLDSPDPLYVTETGPQKVVLKRQRMIFFSNILLQFCRDRVLMDSPVPRERLEKTVQREMLAPLELLDPLVPLDLRFGINHSTYS